MLKEEENTMLKNIGKKVLASGLALVLGLATVACDSKESASGTSDGNGATLSIAARGGSHVDAINAVKDAFEKDHNVKIEVTGYENADLKTNIMLDSSNNTGDFDLVMLDDPWIPEMTQANILYNLTEHKYESDPDFIQASMDIGKAPHATGDQFALPFAGNVMLLFYNTEMVKDAPTSWEGVLDLANQVKSDGKLGYVIRGQQGNPIVSDWLPIFWANGGDVFDKDWKATVNNEAGIEALKLYIKLLNSGANYEKNDLVSSVADGNAAMALGWPSWFVTDEGATAAYAPIPGKFSESSEEHPAGLIGNWFMGVTANSGNKDIAVELLKYLTSAESQKEMAKVGGVPTRTSVLNDAELVEANPHFPTLAEGTEKSKVRPRTEKWGECEEALGAELSAAVTGAKSVEQALADAEKEMNKIMGK